LLIQNNGRPSAFSNAWRQRSSFFTNEAGGNMMMFMNLIWAWKSSVTDPSTLL
jgi:hypothetical protein